MDEATLFRKEKEFWCSTIDFPCHEDELRSIPVNKDVEQFVWFANPQQKTDSVQGKNAQVQNFTSSENSEFFWFEKGDGKSLTSPGGNVQSGQKNEILLKKM